jgi:hypothetical protein
LETIDRK